MPAKIIPAVMCGGAGTRLWPVSRNTMPKQFVSLLGHESTFQRTMRLLADATVFDQALVVTNAEYRFTVLDQLQAIGIAAQIVLEPARRDSVAAVATATELAVARDERAIVGVFAADHVVQDSTLFVETARQAGVVAAQGRIATIGISPSAPPLAMDISVRVRRSATGRERSPPSSRSRTRRMPPSICSTAISGVPAISSSTPRPCAPNSRRRAIDRRVPGRCRLAIEAGPRFPAVRR